MDDICEKCSTAEITYKVHNPDEESKVSFLCMECMGNPEYLASCPHCDASICVN